MNDNTTILLAILSELQATRALLVSLPIAVLASDDDIEVGCELDLDESLTDSVDIDTHINRIEDILKGEKWDDPDGDDEH